MAKYDGIRVIESSISIKVDNNHIGTIDCDKKYATSVSNNNLVVVYWDNGTIRNYYIGHENKYNLMVYNFTNKDGIHDGFYCDCSKTCITGTLWACLKCRDTFICNSCYFINEGHKDHEICRIDSPNTMGSFVGRRSKPTKYIGMSVGSLVENSEELSCTSLCGTIQSIDFDYKKKKTMIKIKRSNETIKYCKGYLNLKLQDNVSGDQNSVQIDPDQLRILGHNPIFNIQLYMHYKEKIDKFASDFKYDVPELLLGDVVYIDCFSALDLKDFQKRCGESNTDIEALIGKPGIVVEIVDCVVRVHYDRIDKDIQINKKALFNSKMCDQTIIRITSDGSFIKEEVQKWIDKIKEGYVKLDEKKWYPGEFIQNEIKGKIGVIVLNGLPDDLAVVRFKKSKFTFGVLLPKSVCQDINQSRDELTLEAEYSITIAHYQFTDSEKKQISMFKSLIDGDKVDDLNDQISGLSIHMWQELFNYAIKLKKKDIIKMLLSTMNQVSIVHEYLLERLSRLPEKHEDQSDIIIDVILENTKLDFNRRTSDGDSILHLASKNHYNVCLSKILALDKDHINSQNPLTYYTAFHYAVENNQVDTVRILMAHNCNIYAKTKDGFTALHIALHHYYLDVFLVIIESLGSEYLDVERTDGDENTILHLAASLPDEDRQKRWISMINSEGVGNNLLTDISQKFQDFIDKTDSKKGFIIKTESVFILSCLLLRKGKNADRVWHQNYNKRNETPAKLFDNSIKKIKQDLEFDDINRLLELFRRYQNSNPNVTMCSFCRNDFATITYMPCNHILHCLHCSFMTFKCAECGEDISEKMNGIKKIKGFRELGEMAKNAIDIPYPVNMNDWFSIIENLLSERTCQSCKIKSCKICLHCGHMICEDCKRQCKRCPICQEDIKEFTEIKSWL